MISEKTYRRGRVLLAILAAGLVLMGCGPGPGGQGITVTFEPDDGSTIFLNGIADFIPVRGQFLFEDVFVDGEDLLAGVQVVTRPVRAVDVAAVDASTGRDLQLAPAATDDNGEFLLFVPNNRPFLLQLRASISVRSDRVTATVFTDPLTNTRYFEQFGDGDGVTPIDPTGFASVTFSTYTIPRQDTVQGPLGPEVIRPSAPFNILDAVLTSADQFRTQTGVSAPGPIALYWNEGITVGSFFSSRYGTAGTPGIQIKGGDSDVDDTDEFDDGVIQHEFGHFIAFSTSRDSSLGGSHFPSDILYPSLAWSEGFANFFSGFSRGRPAVTDTDSLTSPGGPTVFTIPLENFPVPVPGLGVEGSVMEILWDLADGPATGFPDTDNDPVSLVLRNIFLPFFDLRTQSPPPYVDLYEYLTNLVNRGILSAAAVDNLLQTPEDQDIPFNPIPAGAEFPQAIVVNGPVIDDDCTTRNVTNAGFTGTDVTNRFRVFSLTVPTRVTVTLTNTTVNPIDPGVTGQNQNGTNLEFRVFTIDNVPAVDLDTGNRLTPSVNQELPVETASGTLAAGTYVIWVNGRATDSLGNLTNVPSVANSFLLQLTSP